MARGMEDVDLAGSSDLAFVHPFALDLYALEIGLLVVVFYDAEQGLDGVCDSGVSSALPI